MPTVYNTARSGKLGKGMALPSSHSLNCQMTLRHSRYAIPNFLRNLPKNAGMLSFHKLRLTKV